MTADDARAVVVAAGRVVVKIGSSSLTTAAGGLDPARLRDPRKTDRRCEAECQGEYRDRCR